MDREQIIKALECCYTDKRTCSNCPFQDPAKYMECSGLALSALELIKELTEENERVKLEYAGFEAGTRHAVSFVRADTVRKMQEKLTSFFENDETVKYVEVDAEYINEQIVKIADEMLEELK